MATTVYHIDSRATVDGLTENSGYEIAKHNKYRDRARKLYERPSDRR